jgi:L-fuculose-phosphate aldolase
VTHGSARRELLGAARELSTSGLAASRSTSGNLSTRIKTGLLITPTGVRYEVMAAGDLVELDSQGLPRAGQLAPSSEWRFHRDIYRSRPEAKAIVHAHPPFATALACLRRGIPAFHYMVAVAGGADVRCADYATFGTPELSRNAVTALEGRRACLLANHGIIAFGDTIAKALALAIEVEHLAAQYCRAVQIGTPVILDAAEMARVVGKFKTYGQQAAKAPGSERIRGQLFPRKPGR